MKVDKYQLAKGMIVLLHQDKRVFLTCAIKYGALLDAWVCFRWVWCVQQKARIHIYRSQKTLLSPLETSQPFMWSFLSHKPKANFEKERKWLKKKFDEKKYKVFLQEKYKVL